MRLRRGIRRSRAVLLITMLLWLGVALANKVSILTSSDGLLETGNMAVPERVPGGNGDSKMPEPPAATLPPSPSGCLVALGEGASLGGMLPFPSDNPWNQDISKAEVDPNSAAILAKTDLGTSLHPEFGRGLYAGSKMGIPYVVVPETQPMVRIDFTSYASSSDPGPYRIPPNAPIEGLGTTDDYNDRHVLVVQRDCSKPNGLGRLYETFATFPVGNYPSSVDYWRAAAGAIFDLNSNALRPPGWTSADAAGLPIFPGLVRYDEVAAGEIRHALRFTIAPGYTRKGYVYPATHHAGYGTTSEYAPFGMRVRLKPDVDISYLPPNVQIIARAMKKYGMLLADNGGNWFVTGAPDERWNNDELVWLGYLHAGDFEVVKMGAIITP